MKHAVSISLGSATRNKKVTLTLGEETIVIERIGTNGDEAEARRLFTDMDGKVDAFGVGGVELYVRVDDHEYPLRAGLKLVEGVHKTPTVDGRGVKNTLERQVMQVIEPQLSQPIPSRRAMMTLGVDRFGMAQSLAEAGLDVVYCDLMFGLGLPIPIYGIKRLRSVARLMMPVVGLLPIDMIYPTGQKQETNEPKYQKWFDYGSVIAGDFLYIRKHMPLDLSGKTIVTNTTTAADVELLKERGAVNLITTTPVFEGRSFGTNMIEAALTAYAGKGRTLTQTELAGLLQEHHIKPTLQVLNPLGGNAN